MTRAAFELRVLRDRVRELLKRFLRRSNGYGLRRFGCGDRDGRLWRTFYTTRRKNREGNAHE